MSAIWLMIKESATSKKFITAIAGVIAGAFLKIGLDLPVEDVATVLSPIVAYILSQGWADRGKEAAKVQGTVALATSPETSVASLQDTSGIPQAVKDKLL